MFKPTVTLAALVGSLSACMSTMPVENGDDPPVMGEGRCNAEAGKSLIGQKASPENGQRALQLTGARTLRWGPPDSAWTMDYRPDRVNVRYDRNMTITEVTCG